VRFFYSKASLLFFSGGSARLNQPLLLRPLAKPPQRPPFKSLACPGPSNQPARVRRVQQRELYAVIACVSSEEMIFFDLFFRRDADFLAGQIP